MMTPGMILAYVVAGWVMLAATIYLTWVMWTRTKAVKEQQALKRLAVEKSLAQQERQTALLGAVAEGQGRIPGDAEEAVMEARAVRRAQGR